MGFAGTRTAEGQNILTPVQERPFPQNRDLVCKLSGKKFGLKGVEVFSSGRPDS
jgi:hypothetical protein